MQPARSNMGNTDPNPNHELDQPSTRQRSKYTNDYKTIIDRSLLELSGVRPSSGAYATGGTTNLPNTCTTE